MDQEQKIRLGEAANTTMQLLAALRENFRESFFLEPDEFEKVYQAARQNCQSCNTAPKCGGGEMPEFCMIFRENLSQAFARHKQGSGQSHREPVSG